MVNYSYIISRIPVEFIMIRAEDGWDACLAAG